MKAIWRNVTIAESADTAVVEGNHYFPAVDVNNEYLKENDHTTTNPWIGTAHYYDLAIGSNTIENSAWYYPEPKPPAKHIRGMIAFGNGIDIVE